MFFKLKLKGITIKIFLITFIMFMIFFIATISLELFISGYNLIDQKRNDLDEKLIRAGKTINDYLWEQTGEINEYDYELKKLLSQLRKDLSDDNAVCEFLITDNDGNIVCSLRNEIKINVISNPLLYKFAQFDHLSDNELYEIVNTLDEIEGKLKNSTYFMEILGEGIEENKFEDEYYTYISYKIDIYSVSGPLSGKDILLSKDYLNHYTNLNSRETELKLETGKYTENFIRGKYNTPVYFSNVNENRKDLINEVSSGNFSGGYEQSDLIKSVFLKEIKLVNEYSTLNTYNLVMRVQVKPVQSVFNNNKSTYLLLSMLMIFLSVLISYIFSKMTVKPVRKIENKAKRLAELDFSNENDGFEYNREDEIGSLYNSINTLAVNLNDAMSQLKNENKELTESIEKEKALESKRREFIAVTSHELKTPLARIRGYAEALDMNLSEDKKGFYCKSLMTEIDIMNELILDMLSLSKLEVEKYDNLNIEKIDLLKITNEIVNRNLKILADKNITLEIFSEYKTVKCRADRAKIERVISNFIDNAIHYTGEGKKIRIDLKETGEKVCFEIENEGNNIDNEIMPYIWESFYKADKARTKNKKGVTSERTGLGLSIVKAILELHQADFGVKNTQTGVAFYFELNNLTNRQK